MVIDAEQTYLQAAINHLVLTLQYKYNKEYPWVYNTYQCYRKVCQNLMCQRHCTFLPQLGSTMLKVIILAGPERMCDLL